jgi:hypothetical protein
MSTYIQQLRDSLNLDNHHVPFIYNPPELEMEEKVNGYESMKEVFKQSVESHLSSIPEYKCRICEDSIPHYVSVRHLRYSSSCCDEDPYELFLDCIYGCCLSCSDKIEKGELDHTINRVTYGDVTFGDFETNNIIDQDGNTKTEELESISLGSIVDSVIKDDE